MTTPSYQRSQLPIWVQGWLETKGPALVFIAQKTPKGPYLADANTPAKTAFHTWTGLDIPVYEQVEEHRRADIKAWEAFANKDLETLASFVCYKEEIDGILHETIKTPIDETFIVILTKPLA